MAPLGVNRRELLAYLLGLPPTLALGCAGRKTPPLPPGEREDDATRDALWQTNITTTMADEASGRQSKV